MVFATFHVVLLFMLCLEWGSSLQFLNRWRDSGGVTLTTSRSLLDEISSGEADEGRLLEQIPSLVEAKANRRTSVKKLTGCYEVQTTTGQPSWTKYSRLITVDKSQNKNYQIFGKGNEFINLSEYGFGLFATASGVYEKSSAEPNTFLAEVNSVTIHFGSKIELPLKVRGTGVISLLYSDPKLRIIKSEEGACAIQCPCPPPAKYLALLERRGITGL